MNKTASSLTLLCCLFFAAVELFAQTPAQQAIQRFKNDPQLLGASVGFCAVDAQNGKAIAGNSPQLNLAPASVLKLVTTAAALDILGPDYQFTTSFSLDSALVNGKAEQSLVITAGGDPSIASKYFFSAHEASQLIKNWAQTIAQKIPQKNIQRIVVDLSAYDSQHIPNTWIWEDMGNYYGAGVHALSIYDNMCTIHFKSPHQSGQATSIIGVSPKSVNIKFNNQVLSSDINRDHAYVFGSPFDDYRVIRGTIPKNQTDFKVKASLPSPPQTLAQELANHLQQMGVSVKKIELSYTPVSSSQLLFKYHSPKLKQIVSVTNHESVNLFAEHLVKQLAYEKYGQGNFKQGIQIIKDYWAAKGIDFAFLEDGSGLSRFNAISAEQLTQVLLLTHQNKKIATAFFGSLPVAPNGTLWYFPKEKFPNQCLRIKSGSMTRIRSFSGELKTDNGKTLLFSLIINNFGVSQNDIIRKIQTLLLDLKTNY